MNNKAEIVIVGGSKFDLGKLMPAANLLESFGIGFHLKLLELHKNPSALQEFVEFVNKYELKVIIAGNSGAAHLPGMLAAAIPLPVIGVPIKSENSIDGLDAIYSILQMPEGVPVATMGLNNAYNAALFAIQILAIKHNSYYDVISAYKEKLKTSAIDENNKLQALGHNLYFKSE